MRTTTAESLLGLLSFGPKSGYDLKHLIETSTSNFWSESFGQIYPALKKMTEDGLVTMEEQQPEGARLRKEYKLTAAGKGKLKEWLAEPCGQQVRREELLLKLFFGDKAPKGAMRRAVMERKALAESDLARYAEIEKGIAAQVGVHPGAPYWRMTLEFGKAHATALVGWCESTLQELESLEKASSTREKGGTRNAR